MQMLDVGYENDTVKSIDRKTYCKV